MQLYTTKHAKANTSFLFLLLGSISLSAQFYVPLPGLENGSYNGYIAPDVYSTEVLDIPGQGIIRFEATFKNADKPNRIEYNDKVDDQTLIFNYTYDAGGKLIRTVQEDDYQGDISYLTNYYTYQGNIPTMMQEYASFDPSDNDSDLISESIIYTNASGQVTSFSRKQDTSIFIGVYPLVKYDSIVYTYLPSGKVSQISQYLYKPKRKIWLEETRDVYTYNSLNEVTLLEIFDSNNQNFALGLSFQKTSNDGGDTTSSFVVKEIDDIIGNVSYLRGVAGIGNEQTFIQISKPVLKAYPNPSNGSSTTIALTGKVIQSVSVLDMKGATVFTQTQIQAEKTTLNLGGLHSGNYIIQATDAVGVVYTTKYVVE